MLFRGLWLEPLRDSRLTPAAHRDCAARRAPGMESFGHRQLAVRWALLVVALLSVLGAGLAAAAEPVRYARRDAAGVQLHVIDVDLNDPRVVVSPAMAAGGRGHCESFTRFVSRLKPAAAVNGTFFSKRSQLPVGDIVIGGRVAHFGGMGTAIAFAADGVDAIRLPKSRRVDWSEHRAALAGGPLLVWDGYAKPLPGGEGFGDPHVFARSAPRSAVGVTAGNHLLLVTTAGGSSLAALARAMRHLGTVYAVNLDGGSSCGMYYRGRMIRGAGRSLTNVLAVHLRQEAKPRPPLRPPRGLDWRKGHGPRPGVSFTVRGIRFYIRLPRRWEGETTAIHLRANRDLPPGWVARVRVDQEAVGTLSALPADAELDLSKLDPMGEHEWRVNVIDGDGKVLGHVERIFRIGQAGLGRK